MTPIHPDHCPHGHEYTPDNTYLLQGKYKACRACKKTPESLERHRKAQSLAREKRNLAKYGRKKALPDQTERFWNKVNKTETCWLWTGAKTSHNYGNFCWNGKTTSAHIVSYTLLIGKVPEGYELDHLCRIHNCVNPEHLDPVLHKVNTQRGLVGHWRKHILYCKHGHSLNDAYITPSTGYRSCRTCLSIKNKTRKRRTSTIGNID